MLTGLWKLKDIQILRQNRSENKLVTGSRRNPEPAIQKLKDIQILRQNRSKNKLVMGSRRNPEPAIQDCL